MKNNVLTNQTHPLITPDHLRRLAVIYVRQATVDRDNTGSVDFQRGLAKVARSFGWRDSQIITIDEDLGKSGLSSKQRSGLQRLQTMIADKQVGAVFVATISRLSRNVLDLELFRMLAVLHNTLLYTEGQFVNLTASNDIVISQITAIVAQLANRKIGPVRVITEKTRKTDEKQRSFNSDPSSRHP